MDEEERYELIEQYLEGDLSGQARLDFEQEMKTNEALTVEVELHREVRDAILDEKEVELEQTLKNIGDEYRQSDSGQSAQGTRLGRRQFLMIAASVVLLAVVGWFAISQFSSSSTPEQLFKQHFAPYEVPANMRGKNVPESELQAALASYKDGDFKSAISKLEGLEKKYGIDEQVLFYRAVSELAVGKSQVAKGLFEQVITIPDNQSTVQSQWYLALCWLQMGEPENAKRFLVELADYPNKYQQSAQEILGKID